MNVEKNKTNEMITKIIGVLIIILLLITVVIILYIIVDEHLGTEATSTGIQWNEEAEIENGTQSSLISIPVFTSLEFVADSTIQEVSIYNPQKNECYIDATISVDDTLLWESGALYPGYGVSNISLLETLPAGTYDATYCVRCFDLDTGQELNGSTINFVLYVS